MLLKFLNKEGKMFGWDIKTEVGERIGVYPLSDAITFVADENVLVVEDFRRGPAEGRTFFVADDADYLYQYATRVIFCNERQILADGNPEELFNDESFLAEVGIERPKLLQTTDILKYFGVLGKDDKPKSKKDLKEMFSNLDKDKGQIVK
ncbi:MAG: hypothetical protein E7269_01385 [Lachnospiraceae bacterium]|nr:hypothetical protein [Lachnospiraceae bacterium]